MIPAWNPHGANLVVEQQIADDFARLRRGALRAALLAVIARRPNTLRSYHAERAHLCPIGASDRGVRPVPIAQIVGSTDRAGDFDPAFRPRGRHTATRWQSVARAVAAGTPLPPVQLRQVGDAYFVVDGHHRVSVARVRGQQFLDAAVVEDVVRTPLGKPLTRRSPRRGRAWLGRLHSAIRDVRDAAEPVCPCAPRPSGCAGAPS